MAKAEQIDVTPPVEPVVETVLTLTKQEAEDLTVILGVLPVWGPVGETGLTIFKALEASGHKYSSIRNTARNRAARDFDEDRYQSFMNWINSRPGDKHV